MTQRSRKKGNKALVEAQKAFELAEEGGKQDVICLAGIQYGMALFQADKIKEGERKFKDVEDIAASLDDFKLLVQILGMKAYAYQMAEIYPSAFKTAQKVQELAEKAGDLAVKADALATQGQVLIDTREEVQSLVKLNEALDIVTKLGDKRREMNLKGALGNYSLTTASWDQARAYFEQARTLALELEEKEYEMGFNGNLGGLMELRGELNQAGAAFEEIYTYMKETGNKDGEIQALRHLVQISTKANNDQGIIQYCQAGVEAAKGISSDHSFYFYEILIPALNKTNQFDELQLTLADAVVEARIAKNRDKEAVFILSLGESYFATGKLEPALETYKQALAVVLRVQKLIDAAHVNGRIGVVLAEMGQPEAAIQYHQASIELARKNEVPRLEGEQLVMLAMAHQDLGDIEKALSYGEQAFEVYVAANLNEESEAAKKLIEQIKAAQAN